MKERAACVDRQILCLVRREAGGSEVNDASLPFRGQGAEQP